MKKTLLSIVLLISMGIAYAQSPISSGQTQFNIGVGLSSWGIPVYLGLDFGVHKDITLGTEFSFRSYNENWQGDKYRHGVIGISGNGNYHFNSLFGIPPQWDFYAGLNIGFYVWNSPDNYLGSHSSGLGLGGQIGGRYYFSERMGVNLEFGGGNAFSGGKFGISLKL
jgi:outer membrane immunogenic protein